jgi:hypothetical protein
MAYPFFSFTVSMTRATAPAGILSAHIRVSIRSWGGYKITTVDADQIITWWSQSPGGNIGVPTGEVSGWYVVDVDRKHNGIDTHKNFIERQPDTIPSATLKVHTGRRIPSDLWTSGGRTM